MESRCIVCDQKFSKYGLLYLDKFPVEESYYYDHKTNLHLCAFCENKVRKTPSGRTMLMNFERGKLEQDKTETLMKIKKYAKREV